MRREVAREQHWVTQPARRRGNRHSPVLAASCRPSRSRTVELCWKCNCSAAAEAVLSKALTLKHQKALHEADKTSPERFSAQQMTSVVYDWQHFAMHSFKRNKAVHKCRGFLSVSDAGSFF